MSTNLSESERRILFAVATGARWSEQGWAFGLRPSQHLPETMVFKMRRRGLITWHGGDGRCYARNPIHLTAEGQSVYQELRGRE